MIVISHFHFVFFQLCTVLLDTCTQFCQSTQLKICKHCKHKLHHPMTTATVVIGWWSLCLQCLQILSWVDLSMGRLGRHPHWPKVWAGQDCKNLSALDTGGSYHLNAELLAPLSYENGQKAFSFEKPSPHQSFAHGSHWGPHLPVVGSCSTFAMVYQSHFCKYWILPV